MDRARVVADTETWFRAHGLSYFVEEERDAARAATRPRRLIPLALLIVLLAAAAGGLLGWVSDTYSAGSALWLSLAVLGMVVHLTRALHARPIVGWALGRTLGGLRLLLPMVSRALPLLLVFLAFLFINAEAWQMTSALPFGTVWVAVLLLLGLAVLFLLVRLPEEVDRADDAVDDHFVLRACAGTPLEEAARALVDDPATDPAEHAQVTGWERFNLILVLLVVQTVQVLLLTLSVFVFLLLFGTLVMEADVQRSWTGLPDLTSAPLVDSVSTSLVKVSLFLAAFAGLYFTVSAVTDETYRGQFFGAVESELERAVGVRAVYRHLRDDPDPGPDVTAAGTPAPPAPAG